MGFWDKIKSKVFGQHEQAAPPPVRTSAIETSVAAGINAAAASVAASAARNSAATPTATATPAPRPTVVASAQPASYAGSAAPQTIDVTDVLDKAVAESGQKLDWRHSIVDLLKAIDIDSSLTTRKDLAAELGYTGDASDSATMNIWLHKAVIKKLAENGGKVPADLLD